MKKKLLMCLLCGCMCITPFTTHAATNEVEAPVEQTVETATDGVSRASWGKGTLTHANPLGRKPWAYAKSETYAGTCYTIKARTKVVSGGYTDYTSWATKNNASSVTSATIVARTEDNVKFTGEHRFQDTSTSGWQSATTTKSY